MRIFAGRGSSVPPIVGAALFALCAVSAPSLAQTGSSAKKGAAASEQVIITNMPAEKSRVRRLLARFLGKAQGRGLETTGSEVWSVPQSKFPRMAMLLERLGCKVIRLRENWNHILRRNKDPVQLTPRQQAVMDKTNKSPETVSVGVLTMPEAAVAEHAMRGEVPPGKGAVGSAEDRYAKVVLPLNEKQDITLVRKVPTVKTEGGFTWIGEVEDTGERAVLMLWKDGHLSGYFGHKGRIFAVNHVGGTVHTMAEIDPRKLPPDHAPGMQQKSASSTARDSSTTLSPSQPAPPRAAPPEPAVAPFPDAQRRALEAKKFTIDLMILYTKSAANHYIRDPADLLALAVEEANNTFKNSGLGNISLRLVHSQAIDYDEAGVDQFDLLYRMVDGVGSFKDVKKLRNEKRADIVGLIINDPSGCGLSTRVGADSEDAYFVVHHSCAAITNSIVHEVGHILGARHDRLIDSNEAPFPYGHGYVNGTKWRDIMSYQAGCGGCPRIPYWSNPRVMYKGEPTGTAATDNARVILEQAERVSNFR